MADYFPFLRNVYFFRDLSDEEIRRMLDACSVEEVPRGNILFREGDPADRFFIVREGSVEVWKQYGSSDADMLATHGAGHLFGEMALVDDLPRSATVIVAEDASFLTLNREQFRRILSENAQISLSVMKSLSDMVRKSNESFMDDLKEKNRSLLKANEDLRLAQQELIRRERLSTLGKFSSMILHDIRNPISVLKSYSQMMLAGEDLSEKHRGYMRNILFEADRLARLANELLDYSRGEVRLDPSPVPLDEFMEEIRRFGEKRLEGKGVRFSVDGTPSVTAIFDRERMFRVVMNLMENARKALGRDGALDVRVDARDGSLSISVTDDGAGMDSETLANIFEPFYSADKKGGTGLGMVIVKSIVDAHEGRVEIDSEPGNGTSVKIFVPLRD